MKLPKTACGLTPYTQIWWGDSGYHGGDEMKAPAVGKPLEDGMANQLPIVRRSMPPATSMASVAQHPRRRFIGADRQAIADRCGEGYCPQSESTQIEVVPSFVANTSSMRTVRTVVAP